MARVAPILILRHATHMTGFYDVLFDWARAEAPDVLEHVRLCNLPAPVQQWWALRVAVFWLQDPVQLWSPPTYAAAERVAAECIARGIRVINRPKFYTNAGKAECARRVASAGLRTPRMALITNVAAFRRDFGGLKLPLFVREDWGHGSRMLRADTPEEVNALPVESFRRPVAVELVDARDARDGLFHKYRYLACGEVGIAQHIQASESWITRGGGRVVTPLTREEELAYVSQPDPHHKRLQAARQALGFDVVAFDYGYDQDGEVIVWEANPFPHIVFGDASIAYRNIATHRSIAAMLALYLGSARIELPARIQELITY